MTTAIITDITEAPACDFVTITIQVSRLEAGFFYRWRQLRKQGRRRLLVEFKDDTLEVTPLDEPEVLGKKNGAGG